MSIFHNISVDVDVAATGRWGFGKPLKMFDWNSRPYVLSESINIAYIDWFVDMWIRNFLYRHF